MRGMQEAAIAGLLRHSASWGAHGLGGAAFVSSVALRFRNLFLLMSWRLMCCSLWLSCPRDTGKKPSRRSRHSNEPMGGGRLSGRALRLACIMFKSHRRDQGGLLKAIILRRTTWPTQAHFSIRHAADQQALLFDPLAGLMAHSKLKVDRCQVMAAASCIWNIHLTCMHADAYASARSVQSSRAGSLSYYSGADLSKGLHLHSQLKPGFCNVMELSCHSLLLYLAPRRAMSP